MDRSPGSAGESVFCFEYIGDTDRSLPPTLIGGTTNALNAFIAAHPHEAGLAYAQKRVVPSAALHCIAKHFSPAENAPDAPPPVLRARRWTEQEEETIRFQPRAALEFLAASHQCLVEADPAAGDVLKGLKVFVARDVKD